MAKRKKYKPHRKPGSASDNSSCRNYNSSIVLLLAYMHRYLFPIAVGILPLLIARTIGMDYLFVLWGCAFILYASYDIIVYKCRWRHIYCSYQNASRRKMTPDHVHWDEIKKSDIYGMSAIWGCFGVISIIVSFFL